MTDAEARLVAVQQVLNGMLKPESYVEHQNAARDARRVYIDLLKDENIDLNTIAPEDLYLLEHYAVSTSLSNELMGDVLGVTRAALAQPAPLSLPAGAAALYMNQHANTAAAKQVRQLFETADWAVSIATNAEARKTAADQLIVSINKALSHPLDYIRGFTMPQRVEKASLLENTLNDPVALHAALAEQSTKAAINNTVLLQVGLNAANFLKKGLGSADINSPPWPGGGEAIVTPEGITMPIAAINRGNSGASTSPFNAGIMNMADNTEPPKPTGRLPERLSKNVPAEISNAAEEWLAALTRKDEKNAAEAHDRLIKSYFNAVYQAFDADTEGYGGIYQHNYQVTYPNIKHNIDTLIKAARTEALLIVTDAPSGSRLIPSNIYLSRGIQNFTELDQHVRSLNIRTSQLPYVNLSAIITPSGKQTLVMHYGDFEKDMLTDGIQHKTALYASEPAKTMPLVQIETWLKSNGIFNDKQQLAQFLDQLSTPSLPGVDIPKAAIVRQVYVHYPEQRTYGGELLTGVKTKSGELQVYGTVHDHSAANHKRVTLLESPDLIDEVSRHFSAPVTNSQNHASNLSAAMTTTYSEPAHNADISPGP